MRVLRQGLNPNFIYPEAHCVNVILKFKKILQSNKPIYPAIQPTLSLLSNPLRLWRSPSVHSFISQHLRGPPWYRCLYRPYFWDYAYLTCIGVNDCDLSAFRQLQTIELLINTNFFQSLQKKIKLQLRYFSLGKKQTGGQLIEFHLTESVDRIFRSNA